MIKINNYHRLKFLQNFVYYRYDVIMIFVPDIGGSIVSFSYVYGYTAHDITIQGSKLTSVRDRLKSPRASCFHFSLARRTGAVLCCLFHVTSTHARCLRSSLARRTGTITVSGTFR